MLAGRHLGDPRCVSEYHLLGEERGNSGGNDPQLVGFLEHLAACCVKQGPGFGGHLHMGEILPGEFLHC